MVEQNRHFAFEHAGQWRSWLESHHSTAAEAWLILYKKKFMDQGLALEQAIEEALCFGWIDGKLKSLDKKRFLLRFSPRRPKSIWSISNIRRAERLIAEGKMTDAGLRKIAEAHQNGEWDAAKEREHVDDIPESLESALRIANVLELYGALPDSRKKQYIYWLQQAKREETLSRRIRKIIHEISGE